DGRVAVAIGVMLAARTVADGLGVAAAVSTGEVSQAQTVIAPRTPTRPRVRAIDRLMRGFIIGMVLRSEQPDIGPFSSVLAGPSSTDGILPRRRWHGDASTFSRAPLLTRPGS